VQSRGQLHVELTADLPRVQADSSRLTQVLLNLLINAAEALPAVEAGGGNVWVRARSDAQGVALTVSDDGCGIAETDMERVFEPFFTTRAAIGGTGLGLWISRSIIESFDGELELRTAVGRGTTVELRLRAAAGAVRSDPPRDDPSSAPAPGVPLRVLVVDDEPLVLRSVTRFLRGHIVSTETRPAQVLERIRAGEQFDVILTDLTMPGMDGFELLLTAEMIDEGLVGRIVVMSGGTAEEIWRAIREHGNRTIEKPFDGRHLRALVGSFSPRDII
jgi:CheY-like chemotaxis protein